VWDIGLAGWAAVWLDGQLGGLSWARGGCARRDKARLELLWIFFGLQESDVAPSRERLCKSTALQPQCDATPASPILMVAGAPHIRGVEWVKIDIRVSGSRTQIFFYPLDRDMHNNPNDQSSMESLPAYLTTATLSSPTRILSQLACPRLAALRVDGRGYRRKGDGHRGQRPRLGHRGRIRRGPRGRDGARRRGKVDFGLGAHMARRAQPRRVVAAGAGQSQYPSHERAELGMHTRAAVCM